MRSSFYDGDRSENGMTHIGRNDPCPCGGGRKYKHCHGSPLRETLRLPVALPPDLRIRVADDQERLRRRHQGLGRPIMSIVGSDGVRTVTIGDRRMRGKWRMFPDFLHDYMKDVFASDWGNSELAKAPEDRHPLLNLYQKVCWLQNADHLAQGGEIFQSKITGAVSLYLGLAYNLYCVEHNARTQPDWARWIGKLKTTPDFEATCYEAMAAGALTRAGFVLDFVDETADGKKVEFLATYPPTGARFAVECKRRCRGESEKSREGKHLSQAISQNQTGLPLVAFIELDVAQRLDRRDEVPQLLRGAIGRLVRFEKGPGANLPPAYVFVTNQPQAHFLDDEVSYFGYLHGFKIPGLEFREKITLDEMIANRDAHPEIHALLSSFTEHAHVPNTFDGMEAYSEREHASPLECFDVALKAHKDMPRETLLRMMAGWQDADAIEAMTQPELAVHYAKVAGMNLYHAAKQSLDRRAQRPRG